jgi:hypothetical protein
MIAISLGYSFHLFPARKQPLSEFHLRITHVEDVGSMTMIN